MTLDHHDCQHLCGCKGGLETDRRDFLKLAVLGAGAAVALSSFPTTAALAAGNADALLLSCMDFRLVDDTARYMEGRHLTNHYDHVVLAGASLGAVHDKFSAWHGTFWEHVDVAIQLHHIKKVMVLDHRDCGAYKIALGKDLAGDRAAETAAHADVLKKFRAAVKAKYPTLEVELMLMDLDGKVETIA